MVDLVKRYKKAVTLSVGDGANDVSMIKSEPSWFVDGFIQSVSLHVCTVVISNIFSSYSNIASFSYIQ